MEPLPVHKLLRRLLQVFSFLFASLVVASGSEAGTSNPNLFIVVGNDFESSKLCARIVAHILGVCAYGLWDGTGAIKGPPAQWSSQGESGTTEHSVSVINSWQKSVYENTAKINDGSNSTRYVVAIRDRTVSARPDLSDSDYFNQFSISDADKTFVWSYETTVLLRTPYLKLMCSFLYSNCKHVDEESLPLPLVDLNRQFLPEKEPVLEPASTIVNTTAYTDTHDLISWDQEKTEGLCEFEQAVVVVGTESSGSEHAAKLAAHALGVAPYGTWAGSGSVVQSKKSRGNKKPNTVWHKSYPAGTGDLFTFEKRHTFANKYRGCDIKYVVATRDWNVAHLSAMRRFDKSRKWPVLHSTAVDLLRDVLTKQKSLFIVSFEAENVLGGPYYQRLYQYLGLPKEYSFLPADQKDENEKYFKDIQLRKQAAPKNDKNSGNSTGQQQQQQEQEQHLQVVDPIPVERFIVVSNDRAISDMCTRIVAYILQILSFEKSTSMYAPETGKIEKNWQAFKTKKQNQEEGGATSVRGIGVWEAFTDKHTGAVKWITVVDRYLDVEYTNNERDAVPHYYGAKNKYIFAIRDPAGASQPNIGNSGYFDQFKIDENHSSSYVWSYESLLVLKYPYLKHMCSFLGTGYCAGINKTSFSYLMDSVPGFTATYNAINEFSHPTASKSSNSSSAIVHALAAIKGPSDVYVVIGNDDVTTQLCARIVAHLLHIKSFDLNKWDGLGEVGIKFTDKATTGQVKWKVVVNGYNRDIFDAEVNSGPVVEYPPPDMNIKYIFAIRNPAGASQPNMGNSGYFNQFNSNGNRTSSYVWSYESLLVLKYPYLRDICWFLGISGGCKDTNIDTLPIRELQ